MNAFMDLKSLQQPTTWGHSGLRWTLLLSSTNHLANTVLVSQLLQFSLPLIHPYHVPLIHPYHVPISTNSQPASHSSTTQLLPSGQGISLHYSNLPSFLVIGTLIAIPPLYSPSVSWSSPCILSHVVKSSTAFLPKLFWQTPYFTVTHIIYCIDLY